MNNITKLKNKIIYLCIKSIKLLSLGLFCFFIHSNSLLQASQKIDIIFTAKMPDITNEKYGSFSEISSLIKNTKKQNANTLFIFGGGSLGPSAMSSLDRGSHIIDILNNLEPDAMAVSKKEFIFYEDGLSLRSYEAAFPLVSSNTIDTTTNKNFDGIKDYVILEKANIKIGFISILHKIVLEEYNLKRTIIKNTKDAIIEKSNILKKKGANFIIVHSSEFMKEINDLLEDNTIDLAFTKDSDFNIDKSTSPNKKYFILTNLDSIAKIIIELQGKKISTIKKDIQSLSKQTKEPLIESKLDTYKTKLNLLLSERIGVFQEEVDSTRSTVRTKESSFGNFVTDIFRDYTGADIAIYNGGSIRGNTLYKKGHNITRKDIYKELPYRNRIILLSVTGEQLLEAFENSFSLIEKTKGRFLQVSGLKVTYDLTQKPGKRLKSILINNQKIDKKKLYKLATTSYIATGGDGYTMF